MRRLEIEAPKRIQDQSTNRLIHRGRTVLTPSRFGKYRVGTKKKGRENQLPSVPFIRRKSASPQVQSGAILIGLIDPSDLTIAENIDPHDRHFAKHRSSPSNFGIVSPSLVPDNDYPCDFSSKPEEPTANEKTTER